MVGGALRHEELFQRKIENRWPKALQVSLGGRVHTWATDTHISLSKALPHSLEQLVSQHRATG